MRCVDGEKIKITFAKKITPDLFRLWLDEMEFPQDEREFSKLLEEIKGISSILEIGSRFGVSLTRFSQVMNPGSKVVAVDLPGDDESMIFLDSETSLRERAKKIGEKHQMSLFFGDSHDPEMVSKVKELSPFDFIFIDGDHTEKGVRLDWENYGPMGRMIGFHDIGPYSKLSCKNVWSEIKGQYRHKEFLDSGWMGIGILWR